MGKELVLKSNCDDEEGLSTCVSLCDMVAVRSVSGKGRGLFSLREVMAGEIVCSDEGVLLQGSESSAFAIQCDEDLYLELQHSPLRFINHSCSPNCQLIIDRDRILFKALRSIGEDEELSFNYNTSEYDMQSWDCSFPCACASWNCDSLVRGFRFLATSRRQGIRDWLTPYLTKVFEGEISRT